MEWTVPITFYDGDPLTAAQLNSQLRDNLLASELGVSTVNNRMITTDNTHTISEKQWARAYDGSAFVTDSHWFITENEEGDLLGPTVTVQHSGQLLLLYDVRLDMNAGNGNCVYVPVVDGDRPDGTKEAIRSGSEGFKRHMGVSLWNGNPGVSTVTMAYGVSNGSSGCGYTQRRLTVIPI